MTHFNLMPARIRKGRVGNGHQSNGRCPRTLMTATLGISLALACTETNHRYEGTPPFETQDAARLLTAHSRALATGDTARIRPFWSERSLSRDGFWFLNSCPAET